MPRILTRAHDRMRIYALGERLPGQRDAPHGQVVVEWAGRLGHPSSYGLLGIAPGAPRAKIVDAPFPRSLAGRLDVVRFGLPPEYVAVVDGEDITVAAHGAAGSSVLVFRALLAVLKKEIVMKASDSDVWKVFDAVFADVVRAAVPVSPSSPLDEQVGNPRQ